MDLYFQAWRQRNAGVGVALLMVGGMMAEGLSLALLLVEIPCLQPADRI